MYASLLWPGGSRSGCQANLWVGRMSFSAFSLHYIHHSLAVLSPSMFFVWYSHFWLCWSTSTPKTLFCTPWRTALQWAGRYLSHLCVCVCVRMSVCVNVCECVCVCVLGVVGLPGLTAPQRTWFFVFPFTSNSRVSCCFLSLLSILQCKLGWFWKVDSEW